jgi:hypothetical protein
MRWHLAGHVRLREFRITEEHSLGQLCLDRCATRLPVSVSVVEDERPKYPR